MQTSVLASRRLTCGLSPCCHVNAARLAPIRVATAGKRTDDTFLYSFAGKADESVSEVSLVPGLQEFAAAVWEQRQAAMPRHADPLDFLFAEFDEDGDGSLTSQEIANALRSKGVAVVPNRVQKFIDDIDINKNGTVERDEFANFIFRLAVADLKHEEDADAD